MIVCRARATFPVKLNETVLPQAQIKKSQHHLPTAGNLCKLTLVGIAIFVQILVLSRTGVGQVTGQVLNRTMGPIDSQDRVHLNDNISPRVAQSTDQGAVPAGSRLNHMLPMPKPSPEQHALATPLEQQRDPHSSNYHRWLTPEQYQTIAGLTDADIATLTDWLTQRTYCDLPLARTQRREAAG
jgi:hypothetical protein